MNSKSLIETLLREYFELASYEQNLKQKYLSVCIYFIASKLYLNFRI